MTTPSQPEGYMRDALGRLVPNEQVRAIDLLRDDLVRRLYAKAEQLHCDIAAFKGLAFGEIAAFIQTSLQEHGVHRGGRKGNVSLLSYDGRYKIERAMADVIRFDEQLAAAKALIDECLQDWSSDARPELRAIVEDAFSVDKQSNIRVQQVLSLRRLSIDDERWRRAMEAISASIQILQTKAYVRFYERIGDSDQWRPLPLDIAAVQVPE
jgi:hypothetical protein